MHHRTASHDHTIIQEADSELHRKVFISEETSAAGSVTSRRYKDETKQFLHHLL